MKNAIFEGWKLIYPNGRRHYFRNGKSLCLAAMLFTDSPSLEGGKGCPVCLRRRVEQKRKAA